MKKNLQSKFNTRQYMTSQDFEIYYYSDKTLSTVQSHTHNYYEFYFFLEGNVSITIADQQYNLKPGDVVLIPPDVPHFAAIHDTASPYRRFVFWISQLFYEDLQKHSKDYIYIIERTALTKQYIFHYDFIAFNALQSKVFELIEELKSEHFGKDLKISLCVHDLLLYLNRSIYEQDHARSNNTNEQYLYQDILKYIERHLDEDLSLDTLAKEFFVSKYHIAHIFKDNLGISVHQFILKKRLAICKDTLLSRTCINEAYLQCGFKDYSSFYRAFKKEYGMSPKAFTESKAISVTTQTTAE